MPRKEKMGWWWWWWWWEETLILFSSQRLFEDRILFIIYPFVPGSHTGVGGVDHHAYLWRLKNKIQVLFFFTILVFFLTYKLLAHFTCFVLIIGFE